MDNGSGLNINTVELINAADGFAAASKDTQRHASALEEVLRPYALSPDRFQGPQADEFRRLYREISDDLATVKAEAMAMSTLVEQAKTEFSKHATNAAGQLPRPSGGGGSVLQTLTGR
jgi:hypothetical protein